MNTPNTLGFDKMSMAISTLMRLGAAFATFMLLARFLGPIAYGVFGTAITYSTLLSMASDYGLGNYMLREAGQHRENAVRIVRRGLVLKAWTTAVSVLIFVIVLIVLRPTKEIAFVHATVFLGVYAAAIGDLAFVLVRALGRIDIEARSVVLSNVLMLAILLGIAYSTSDLVITALAFAGTRLLYLGITAFTLRKWLFGPGDWPTDRAGMLLVMRQASNFAADGILTNLSSQIDVVMASLVLAHESLGVYQVGARLVQSISPFVAILATVYIPRLAHIRHDTEKYSKLQDSIILEFATLAIAAGLLFYLVAPMVSLQVFGERYSGLAALWPGFAAFAFARVFLSGLGVLLYSENKVGFRIVAQLTSVAIMVVGIFPLISRYGAPALPVLLAISNIVLLPMYGRALWGNGFRSLFLFGLALAAVVASISGIMMKT